jgi:hypothetical protein
MKPLTQGPAGRLANVARRQLDADPPASQEHWPGFAASGSSAEGRRLDYCDGSNSAVRYPDPSLSRACLR